MSVLDVAIVGGGAAGCYCAYRLADPANYKNADGDSYKNIALFEVNDRLGGRLWSVEVKDAAGQPVAGQPVELGGNFINSKHLNVFGLANHLSLEMTKLTWNTGSYFLRGRDVAEDGFALRWPKVPYNLVGKERGKDSEAMRDLALTRILKTQVEKLWPRESAAEPSATINVMKAANPKGRPLWQWGFWNLLAETVSNEAYELMLATYGAASNFRNSNALDAIWALMMELYQDRECFKITGGYDLLPRTLASESKAPVHLNSRLTEVHRSGDQLRLTFVQDGQKREVEARRVILALPPTALKEITFGANVVDERTFYDDIDAVDPIPACKLYLVFETQWWDEPKSKLKALVRAEDVRGAWTDLPIRQCYYFGHPKNHYALMMASFSDDTAAAFWARLSDRRASTPTVGPKWLTPNAEHYGDAHMIRAARHQLSILHGGKVIPEPVLPPVFVNWRDTPSGAGWHSWKPNRESWKVRARMRQASSNLYVCGEGFSQLPGWVEGALNSAEMALTPFELRPPKWVNDTKFMFEYPV